jgi:hypothetical protein
MFKTFLNQTTTRSVLNNHRIYIPIQIWHATWAGLNTRSKGKIESAAIWAGRRDGEIERVEGVYFLDDYVGGLQRRDYHCVPVQALTIFFADLRRDRRVIIADLHTHPRSWVGQSQLDEANPIEFRKGLPAVVLPWFAQGEPSLQSCGVHIYEGGGKWLSLGEDGKKQLLVFN